MQQQNTGLRFLDEFETTNGLDHRNRQGTRAPEAGASDQGRYAYSTNASLKFLTADREGKLADSTEQDIKSYYATKGRLLLAEFVLFLFFLVFGFGAFATLVVETDYGSGWHIPRSYMIAVISVFSGVGALLIAIYLFFAVKFTSKGDEQVDELVANALAFGTMYFCSVGLLIKYFVMNDTDNTDNDLNFRRLFYVVSTTYGVFGMTLLGRAIARHLTAEAIVYISYHSWQYGRLDCLEELPEGPPDGRATSYQTVMKPHRGVLFFLLVMWISTACLLSGITAIFVYTVGASQVPDFRPLYLTLFIGLGTVYLVLTAVWIAWSWMSQAFKSCFTSHFDVFYATHAIYIAVIVFMLIGYRYVYLHVPDDQFESPGVTVPSLKLSYFNKLAILQFVLLPLLAMGIAKGAILMKNEWPVEKELLQKMFGKK